MAARKEKGMKRKRKKKNMARRALRSAQTSGGAAAEGFALKEKTFCCVVLKLQKFLILNLWLLSGYPVGQP